MSASKNRTMIDGIYTDMIIGVDTETPSQRVNVTWGVDNTEINSADRLPVEMTTETAQHNALITLMNKQINGQEEILKELKISNDYQAVGFGFTLK